MKRTICILLSALMGLGMLAGCRKTPEAPLVVGKNNEIMLEKAQADEPAQNDTDAGTVNLYARLNAPRNYTANLVSKGGKLTVQVDAAITLPASELPIARVQSVGFEMDAIHRFAGALLGQDAYYVDMRSDSYTKSFYQKQIGRLKTAIDNWDTTGNLEFDLVYASKQEAEKGLAELLRKAAAAPEVLPEYAPSFAWEADTVGNEQSHGLDAAANKSLYLFTMPDDATVSRLYVREQRRGPNRVMLTYQRDITKPVGVISRDSADVSGLIILSEEEAFKLALSTLESCGCSDFLCTGTQQSIYNSISKTNALPVYDFAFTRQINGVGETYTNAEFSRSDGEAKPWQYEKIHVLINDNGVVYFEYSGPVKVLETMMPTTKLMPFSDIQGIFEKMIVIVNNTADAHSQDSAIRNAYNISEIVLGLMCVSEQDGDTGLLIPVWDFLGYERVTGDMEGSYLVESNGYKSFLTINAIDGSIVERSNGY